MSETLSADKQPILIEGEFIRLNISDRDSLSDAFFKGDSIELFKVDTGESLPKPLQSASLKFQWIKSTDYLTAEGIVDISPSLPKEPGTTWLDSLRRTLGDQLSQSGHSVITFDPDPLSLYLQLDDTYVARITPTAMLGSCSIDISVAKIEDIEDQPWCEHQFDAEKYTLSPTDIMLDTARLFNLTLNTVVQKYGNTSIDNPIETTTLKSRSPKSSTTTSEIAISAVKATALDMITKPKPPIEQQPWPEVSFDEIGGLATQRGFLMDMADILNHPELAKQYGIAPNHILIHGPNGTGKHSLVRAFCHEINGTLTTLRATAVAASTKLFQTAFEATTPQVILVDDLDMTGVPKASGGLPIERQALGTHLERARAQAPHVVIIGITNKPLEAIDPGLIDPDRFVCLPVEMPNTSEREGIWRVMTTTQISLDGTTDQETNNSAQAKFPYIAELDYDELARQSKDMTGLDIKGVLEEARKRCMKLHIAHGEPQLVTMELLLELIETHRSKQSRRQ